jgi:hypothetical protein
MANRTWISTVAMLALMGTIASDSRAADACFDPAEIAAYQAAFETEDACFPPATEPVVVAEPPAPVSAPETDSPIAGCGPDASWSINPSNVADVEGFAMAGETSAVASPLVASSTPREFVKGFSLRASDGDDEGLRQLLGVWTCGSFKTGD